MATSNNEDGEKNGAHEVWTVLPHHMAGGPHGLGMLLLRKPCKRVDALP